MMPEDNKNVLINCRRLATFRQYLAAILASLLGLSYGTAFGWTSPIGPQLTSDESPLPEKIDIYTVAWLGSITYFGSITCTLFWGTLVDRLGRKTAAVLLAVPFMISWIMMIFANSVSWLLVARVLQGVGSTGALINVPVFISEITRDDLRGILGAFLSIAICAGILIAYVIGTYLKYYGLAISSLAIPCVFLVTFTWLPETPVYLWSRGQKEKARESLVWYRGGDVGETEETLLKYELMPKGGKNPSLKALVATRGARKALVIGLALIFALQGSGLLTILCYAVYIFEMCGTSTTPYEAAIILGTVSLIANVLSSVLIDRLGRRVLIIGSLITITLSLAGLGTFLLIFGEKVAEYHFGWVPILLLCVEIVASSGGVGCVMYVILSEIFLPEIKGLAMGKLMLISSMLTFAAIKLFPNIVDSINLYGLFFSYSFSCLLLAVFFYLYLPETKNVPQNVIMDLFNETAKEEKARLLHSTENGKTVFYT